MTKAIQPLLSVKNLSIGFDSDDGLIEVVENVSFDLEAGQTIALVGESGCGKSITAYFILQLLPPFGRILSGSIQLKGVELTDLNESAMQKLRGNRISMIFQEPMSALNPVFTIGTQVAESLILHKAMSKREALSSTIELFGKVGIPDPESRANSYPHQLSGGMRQRVMIAMALACEPDVLIADEPTTALDVTIQAQILDLMHDLQENFGTAILFISHDLSVVSRMADDISVMYAGRIIEHSSSAGILNSAQHPYTQALLATTPQMDTLVDRLPAITGRVPTPGERGLGCYFRPRCSKASALCETSRPEFSVTKLAHYTACHAAVAEYTETKSK